MAAAEAIAHPAPRASADLGASARASVSAEARGVCGRPRCRAYRAAPPPRSGATCLRRRLGARVALAVVIVVLDFVSFMVPLGSLVLAWVIVARPRWALALVARLYADFPSQPDPALAGAGAGVEAEGGAGHG